MNIDEIIKSLDSLNMEELERVHSTVEVMMYEAGPGIYEQFAQDPYGDNCDLGDYE